MFFIAMRFVILIQLNKIKQTPEIIDELLDNLAKDYSRIFRIEKALYSSF